MKLIEKKYQNIVVLGNGFDINLGLKTSYMDFLSSPNFKDLQGKQNHLVEYLSQKHNFQNWIDVEKELKAYSEGITEPDANQCFEAQFNMVSNALKEYLKGLKYEDILKESHSYRLLSELYNKDILILDFNYTMSTRYILKSLGLNEEEINQRVLKVHGDIDGEIIFGIEDAQNVRPQHVFLKKAYNKNFIGINLKEALSKSEEIYFLGSSLGETDHMYFESFFAEYSMPHLYDKGKKIQLYHFGEGSRLGLFMQIDKMSSYHLSIFKQNNKLTLIDSSK